MVTAAVDVTTTTTFIVNVTTATVIVNAPVTICVTVHFSLLLLSCYRSWYCYCGFSEIKLQLYKWNEIFTHKNTYITKAN